MFSFPINPIVAALPPSGIRRFFDLVISAGPDVVSLGVGEPDFSAPWHVRESTIFALEKGFTSYSENAGFLELRKEIVEYTKDFSTYDYNPKTEVLVTNGVSEGMDIAFRAVLSPGDIILVPDPGYVMYAPLITLAGGKVAFYNPLDIASLTVPPGAKGIVLNFPGNPLGNIFSKKELEHIAHLAEVHDLVIFSDEIYHFLTFEGNHTSMVSLPKMAERTILFDGLSKSHAMTGFRIGWVCGPQPILSAMTKIHQYAALCAPSPSQVGAIEALRHGTPSAEKMKEEFGRRRIFCMQRLHEMELSCAHPGGAFYLFAKVGGDDVAFCEDLLKEEKLAIVPGSAFGEYGKGHVRMTYASSMDELKEAMNRLERFWKKKATKSHKK